MESYSSIITIKVQREGRKRESDFNLQKERERDDLFASQKVTSGHVLIINDASKLYGETRGVTMIN